MTSLTFSTSWIEGILLSGAVISAVWVVWTKALRPIANMLSLIDRVVPMLTYLVSHFPDETEFQKWVATGMSNRQEMRARLSRVERVIDYEHPPTRDWTWTPDNVDRVYDRRISESEDQNGKRRDTDDR